MEWFESQAWYKKALTMCGDLSGKGLEALHNDVKAEVSKLSSKLNPAALVKNACAMLDKVPEGQQKMQWFLKAQNLCATIENSSPDELTDLVHRQRGHAETASGQLVKQTCQGLKDQANGGGLQQPAGAPWLTALNSMCEGINGEEVSSSGLEEKCKKFQDLMASGKSQQLQSQDWFQSLATTCKYLGKKAESAAAMPMSESPTAAWNGAAGPLQQAAGNFLAPRMQMGQLPDITV